jgi:hypothetical protein
MILISKKIYLQNPVRTQLNYYKCFPRLVLTRPKAIEGRGLGRIIGFQMAKNSLSTSTIILI